VEYGNRAREREVAQAWKSDAAMVQNPHPDSPENGEMEVLHLPDAFPAEHLLVAHREGA
jgi:hypothetical protein